RAYARPSPAHPPARSGRTLPRAPLALRSSRSSRTACSFLPSLHSFDVVDDRDAQCPFLVVVEVQFHADPDPIAVQVRAYNAPARRPRLATRIFDDANQLHDRISQIVGREL